MAAKGVLFYAARDIAAGAPITRAAFRRDEELCDRIPQNAVQDLSRVIGRKAKYDISSGQLLSFHDLVPNPIATVVEAVNDIPKGAVIIANDLSDIEFGEWEQPKEGFTSRAVVVGKKAKRAIRKGL